MDHTVHASKVGGDGITIYLCKDRIWRSDCSDGHWDSLVTLIQALKSKGHDEVILQVEYIR